MTSIIFPAGGGPSLHTLLNLLGLFAGGVLLMRYRNLANISEAEAQRPLALNVGLAVICGVYLLSGFATPIHQPTSMVGPIFAWIMVVVWLIVAAVTMKLFSAPAEDTGQPLIAASKLGISTTALIAVLEELVFRGWLHNMIMPVAFLLGGSAYAVFGINLLFAALHYKGGTTFALSAGFTGTIFSIATLASGSLVPAIIMHVGWNVMVGIARTRPHRVAPSHA